MKKKKTPAVVTAIIMLAAIIPAAAGYAAVTSETVNLSGTQKGDVYVSEIEGKYDVTSDSTIKNVTVKLGKTKVKEEPYENVTTASGTFTLSKKVLLDEEDSSSDKYTLALEVTEADNAVKVIEKEFKANVSVPEYELNGIKAKNSYNEEKKFTVSLNDGKKKDLEFNLEYKRGDEVLLSGKADSKTKLIADKEGVYTLKSTYTDDAGNKAELDTFVVIDTTAPEITGLDVSGSSVNGIYNDDVTFKVTAKDSDALKTAKIAIGKDYSEEKEFKDSESVSFTVKKAWFEKNAKKDNSYDVKVTVTDAAGNKAEKDITVLADCKTPEIKLTGITDKVILKNAPSLTMSATDNCRDDISISYCIKNGDKIVKEETVKQDKVIFNDFTSDGTYSVEAKAIDKAGNESEPAKLSFTKDKTKPVMSDVKVNGDIRSGYDTYYFADEKSSLDVNAGFEDAVSGIVSVKASIGDVVVKEEAYDKEGSIDMNVSLTKDWIRKHISADNNYKLVYKVTDAAGNELSEEYDLKVDVDVPEVNLGGIKDNAFTNDEEIVIIVVTTDNVVKDCKTTLTITKDGKSYDEVNINGKKSYRYDKFTEDGLYEVSAKAVDAAGNESEIKSLSFTKDTVKPEIEKIKTTGSIKKGYAAYNGTVNLQMAFSDDRSAVKEMSLYIDDDKLCYKTYDGSLSAEEFYDVTSKYLTQNPKKDNMYKGKVVVEDRAGNVSSKNFGFKADTIAPKLNLSGIENGVYTNENQKLELKVTDNSEDLCRTCLSVYRDGKLYKELILKKDKNVYSDFPSDGHYSMKAFTVDEAGNESSTEKVEFTYDTTAPVISISGAKKNSYSSKPVTINISVKERNYMNASFNAKVNTELEGSVKTGKIKVDPDSAEYSVKKTLSEDGTYEITVTGRDKAGNEAVPAKIVFSVDKTAPVVKIENVKSIYGYADKVSPVVSYKDSFIKDVDISLARTDARNVQGIAFKDSKEKYAGKRTYSDFKSVRANDGVYVLSCVIVDKAGNSTRVSKTFTVNRYGSLFSLSGAAEKYEAKYVKNVKSDFAILERNYSTLEGTASIAKDGVTLKNDIAASLNKSGADGKNEYKYLFAKENFTDEGVYTIDVKSKDAAGNINDYAKDNSVYKLCVDRTAPTISISGIEEGGSYKNVVAKINVDDSMKLAEYTVMSNGETIYSSNNSSEISTAANVRLPSGVKQTVSVRAVDAAGNVKTEVLENVTVSESLFVRLFTNPIVQVLLVIVALAIVAAVIYCMTRSRKNSSKQKAEN